MPRNGAYTLSDVREPMLGIECKRCQRYGRYKVANLMAKYGDEYLPALAEKLTVDCTYKQKGPPMRVCQAVFLSRRTWEKPPKSEPDLP